MKYTLPRNAGVTFKAQHLDDMLLDIGRVSFIEVHAENYFSDGGPRHAQLKRVVDRVPLSVHGVGLSLGGFDAPDRNHLARLKKLLSRYPVQSFSEHLAWSSHGDQWVPDLLPIAYDDENLDRMVQHVNHAQEYLDRKILIENPSTYLVLGSMDDELQFLSELAKRTGCGLLLDINNAFVSCGNHGESTEDYLDKFPVEHVGEVHLAGHSRQRLSNGELLRIDDHGSQVTALVWALYERLVQRIGIMPTLIEWDTNIPEWRVLASELDRVRDRTGRALAKASMQKIIQPA